MKTSIYLPSDVWEPLWIGLSLPLIDPESFLRLLVWASSSESSCVLRPLDDAPPKHEGPSSISLSLAGRDDDEEAEADLLLEGLPGRRLSFGAACFDEQSLAVATALVAPFAHSFDFLVGLQDFCVIRRK